MIIIKQHLIDLISNSIKKLNEKNEIPSEAFEVEVVLNPPKIKEHGDLATNFALAAAKKARTNPRKLATLIVENMGKSDLISDISIAGPGFINFKLAAKAMYDGLVRIIESGKNWGKGDKKDLNINLEFVSANPTGPLHVGHGRGAAVGDAISRILRFAGYDVTNEYYLNDAGRQVGKLAESIWYRYSEICKKHGKDVDTGEFPEDGYHGEYVTDMAKKLYDKFSDSLLNKGFDEEFLRNFGINEALNDIKSTLSLLNVEFDLFYSEKELHQNGAIQKAIDLLKNKGLTYELDGALFFKSTEFGDEKDRVLIRSNSDPTYFAADVAYHMNKFDRGFNKLIDLWGADHHGYISRIKGSLKALGQNPDDFEALLVQFVSLVEDGKKLSMGKRSGNFVTLKELIQKVGSDVTRWFFIAKTHDVAIDFDLKTALSNDPKENPARYAQYGHARACSILSKAETTGFKLNYDFSVLNKLDNPEELDLIKMMLQFPELIQNSAISRSPHKIANFLLEISRAFHSYYTGFKNDPILPKNSQMKNGLPEDWDTEKTLARLLWTKAFVITTRNALTVLGLPAPEHMSSPNEEVE